MNQEINPKFTIEQLWQEYLKRGKQSEATMHPVQLAETKKAFFGGVTSFMILLNEEIAEIEDEEECATILQAMSKEGLDFWERQVILHQMSNKINIVKS